MMKNNTTTIIMIPFILLLAGLCMISGLVFAASFGSALGGGEMRVMSPSTSAYVGGDGVAVAVQGDHNTVAVTADTGTASKADDAAGGLLVMGAVLVVLLLVVWSMMSSVKGERWVS